MRRLRSRSAGLGTAVGFLWALAGVAANAAGPPAGHCGGLTAADAAAILHIPQTDVTGPRVVKDVGLEAAYNCSFRDSKNFFKSVNFDLTTASAAAADRNMVEEMQNFGGVGTVALVKNLGDEAVRYTWRGYGPSPRLLMRKGGVWIDIHEPEDEASQIKIARIVLRHLR